MAENVLPKIKRLSDPITVSLYKKDGKRILLLGDRHLPNKDCKTCKAPNCVNYLSLIDELDKYHKEAGTDLDVFFEGFAPAAGRDGIEKTRLYLGELIDRYFLMYKGTPVHLYDVRKALLPKAFFHKGDDVHQRYHYIDFRLTPLFLRYGFDIITIIHGSDEQKRAYFDKFHAMYPTKTSYVNRIKEFCFAKPFDPSLKPRSLLSHGMTKIGKQFHKLGSKDQILVKRFITKRIQTIMDDYDYKVFEQCMANVFFMAAVMMDSYAICRFLYYFSKQTEGSTSVFIAGALHTYNYNLFMKEWKAIEIDEHTYKIEDLHRQSKACTKVDFSSIQY
jgi:hypothetical protein